MFSKGVRVRDSNETEVLAFGSFGCLDNLLLVFPRGPREFDSGVIPPKRSLRLAMINASLGSSTYFNEINSLVSHLLQNNKIKYFLTQKKKNLWLCFVMRRCRT